MVSKSFQFHPEAREEFRNATRWYRAQNVLASSEFRATVSSAIRLIAESSQQWPKYLHGTRRLVMQRFPFSVVYLDEPDFVIIVAVAHSKRRPGYWGDRV
jgi:plasmid stabilization system protein ParE